MNTVERKDQLFKSLGSLITLSALATLAWPAIARAQTTSFVRVHQTGYVAGSPKRAYLLSLA